jgi:hypothetical protein
MRDPSVFAVYLAFCLLGLLPVIADARIDVDIQLTLGFSETFRLDRWAPLTVTVSNRGSDLSGQLEVEVSSGDELRGNPVTTFYRRDLELPGNSRKRFQFTIFPENPAKPLLIRVISATGEPLAQRTLDLRGHFTSARLLLVLSRAADLDYLNDASGESLRVLYPHPELLPERWQGYDGVDALVIQGLSLENLTTRQFEALQMWLAHGGILVIGAGPDYALLHTPRLAGLLPATPVAIAQIADAAIAGNPGTAPATAMAMATNMPRAFDVHRLARVHGRVLYRAGEFPLIIEQNHGRGRVLYLTFDVTRAPFAGWPGMRQLWFDSLRLPAPQPLVVASPATDAAEPVMDVIKRDPRGFPHHTSVCVFLALYLGILATGYRLADGGGLPRRLQPWMTWAAPLLFAPAAYLLFGPLLFPKGANAVVLATIESFPDSPYAHLHLDLGVYASSSSAAAPAAAAFLQFEYAGAEPVLQPVRRPPARAVPALTGVQAARRSSDWVVREGTRRSVQPLDEREYVLHLIEGQDIVVYDLSGTLVTTPNSVRLQLRNDSGRPLYAARLVFGENVYPLGFIAGNTQVERVFANNNNNNNDDDNAGDSGNAAGQDSAAVAVGFSAVDLETAEVAFKDITKRALANLRGQQQPAARSALLLGFARSPLYPREQADGWRYTGLALVLLQIPAGALLPASSAADNDHGG